MIDDKFVVDLGGFYLSNGLTQGKIWIGCHGGEGGEFDIEALEDVIRKFYEEYF